MKNKKFLFLIILSIIVLSFAMFVGCKDGETKDNQSTDEQANNGKTSIVVNDTKLYLSDTSVTICVGDTFSVKASTNNSASLNWCLDGSANKGIISYSQNGSNVNITALKEGETCLVVSYTQNGQLYYRTVSILVKKQNDVSMMLNGDIKMGTSGYCLDLATISTANDTNKATLSGVVYDKNNALNDVPIVFTSKNTNVVEVSNGQAVSVGYGKAIINAQCTVNDIDYSVNISVNVYKPTIDCSSEVLPDIEVENLQQIPLSTEIEGTVSNVCLDGADVGSFNANNNTITFSKNLLPTSSAKLGDNRTLSIITDKVVYNFPVNVYTKVIKTKADFDNMATLSKACSSNSAVWDGYFVLGNDIEYNDSYKSEIAEHGALWSVVEGQWYYGGLHGFKGVFDGKGYNIEGVSIDDGKDMGGIFGVTNIDGVIKNVSFTKAKVSANSSFLTSAGGGTIKNVYIQFDSIGKGVQTFQTNGTISTFSGAFFTFKEPIDTANVSNCVIDITNAKFYNIDGIRIAGSDPTTRKGVIVIGGTEAIRKQSYANYTFASNLEFINNDVAVERYEKYDTSFWSMVGGVPISKSFYDQIKDKEVSFNSKPGSLICGTQYKFELNNDYSYVSYSDTSITNGYFDVTQSDVGKTLTFTAKSLFNVNDTDSFTADIIAVNNVDDLTLGKFYYNNLSSVDTDDILYYVTSDYKVAEVDPSNETVGELIAVTANKLYKISYESVTKVIEQASDLNYMRKDHLTTSYGNTGCYDGVITGKYVLIKDIDCTGLELCDTGCYWENTRGFMGTFDGLNHTISNLTVGINGLFGNLAYATIKNITFNNVYLGESDTTNGAYIALLSSGAFNSTFKNIQVTFSRYIYNESSLFANSGLLFFQMVWDNTFEDITLNIKNVTGVRYIIENDYDEICPFVENKSTYTNFKVIVKDGTDSPVFSYKDVKAGFGEENIQAMASGISIVKEA